MERIREKSDIYKNKIIYVYIYIYKNKIINKILSQTIYRSSKMIFLKKLRIFFIFSPHFFLLVVLNIA